MLFALVIALVILWLAGYIVFPGFIVPSIMLFSINGHPITLWNLLIFLVLIIIASALPSPLREIMFVVVILWVLALLGIIAAVGLPNLLLVGVIAGMIVFLIQGRRSP